MFDGYFREEEQTAKAIDKNGWFHTGDIVELRPNGSVKIIGNKRQHIDIQFPFENYIIFCFFVFFCRFSQEHFQDSTR